MSTSSPIATAKNYIPLSISPYQVNEKIYYTSEKRISKRTIVCSS